MNQTIFDRVYSEDFIKSLRTGTKSPCPCCKRWAQVYKRALHYTVAWQLIRLYKLNGFSQWINAAQLIPPDQQGVGDFTKAKYWDLIERRPLNEEDTTQKSSGWWRLTGKGVSFVLGKIRIEKNVLVFDDNVIGFEGTKVSIGDVLNNNFDYKRLMES